MYWNVTGNGWEFHIEQATAHVELPAGVPAAAVKLDAYTGPQGDKGKAFQGDMDSDGAAVFATTPSRWK